MRGLTAPGRQPVRKARPNSELIARRALLCLHISGRGTGCRLLAVVFSVQRLRRCRQKEGAPELPLAPTCWIWIFPLIPLISASF